MPANFQYHQSHLADGVRCDPRRSLVQPHCVGNESQMDRHTMGLHQETLCVVVATDDRTHAAPTMDASRGACDGGDVRHSIGRYWLVVDNWDDDSGV